MKGIIILNWNGKQDTLECLRSVASMKGADEIVVIDNGSTDGSDEEIVETFPHITFIKSQENLGYAGGNNLAIQYGLEKGWNRFLILNNDTIVDPNLIPAFEETFSKFPKAGILGAKIFQYSDPDRLDHLGGMWNLRKITFDLVGLHELDVMKKWEKPEPLDYVCGACLYIKREVFEKVGLFEARFFLFWEESDFCFRARKEGFEILFCPQAKIWHKGSAAFVGGKPHSTYFYHRSQRLWIERNLSQKKHQVAIRALNKEKWRLRKHYFMRQLQFLHAVFFQPLGLDKRRQQLRQKRAALAGIRDFRRKEFGPGPKWIYQRD